MTRTPIPVRHWRTYGDYPLPTGAEALDESFAAFPSWFLRITCDRCGKVQMVNQVHYARPTMLIREILAKMRHERCDGRAGKVEVGSPASRASAAGRCDASSCATADSSGKRWAAAGWGSPSDGPSSVSGRMGPMRRECPRTVRETDRDNYVIK
jgi:hypothetical protein